MLYPYLSPFLDYFELADFSNRSFQAMNSRINEFQLYLQIHKVKNIKKVTYKHLVEFAGDFQNPSIHVTKSRVLMLRQFYHFLSLHGHVPKNIGVKLPYPKIEKTVPDFLTQDELNRLIHHFAGQAQDLIGLRNLVVILLVGFLGIRTSALIGINIENVDLVSGLLWVYEKGLEERPWGRPRRPWGRP